MNCKNTFDITNAHYFFLNAPSSGLNALSGQQVKPQPSLKTLKYLTEVKTWTFNWLHLGSNIGQVMQVLLLQDVEDKLNTVFGILYKFWNMIIKKLW